MLGKVRTSFYRQLGFPGGSDSKESAYNVGDLGSIPGLRRSPGEGNGYPLQYSGLENSMDCIVHGVTKSRTRLSAFHFSLSKSLELEHHDATTGILITQGAMKGQTANSRTRLGRTKWDLARFHQANHNGLQFKTNRIFLLICSDRG